MWKVVYTDGIIVQEGQKDWDNISKTDIDCIQLIHTTGKKFTLVVPEHTLGVFQFHHAIEGIIPKSKPKQIKQVLGYIINQEGDCVLAMMNQMTGDVTVEINNVHDLKINLEHPGYDIKLGD